MQIIPLTSKNFQAVVEIAGRTIRAGGIVIAPTDTVYGLLADATNKKAVDKIYQIKQRQSDKPLPIFVKNIAMAKKLAKISNKNRKILETKWPGKFTAVFPKKNVKLFGVGDKTTALRIPHYPFINSLLETLNIPLIGTSANISGQPSTTKIDDVLNQFKNIKIALDLVINAGDLPDSNPSAIVCLVQSKPKIIRS